MADKKISQLTGATTPLAGTEVLPIVQSSSTVKVSIANVTAGRAVSADSLTTTNDVTTGRNIVVTGAGTIEQNGAAGGLYFANSAVSGGATNQRFYTTNASGVKQLQLYLGGGTTQTNDVYGNFNLATGNLVPSTAAKGINFTANTGAAGMTSQLLNWYEEGTFTPTVSGSTSAGTGTYSTQNGYYTRVGSLVTCQIYIAWSGHTGTGDLLLTNLPFSFKSNTYAAATVGYCNNLSLSANNVLTVFANAAGTTMLFYQYPVGGGAVSAVPMDTSADVVLSVTYRV